MRLIPKRKIEGSEELMNSLALEKTATKLPLDDTAVDGRTQEGITSNWAYDHNAATTGVHGITGTVLGTEDVDDTPENGATTAPVSSNWAFDTAARLDDVSQSDISGSRAVDGTVYQNTSGKIRIVTIQCQFETTNAACTSTLTIHSDSNATPTTQISKIGTFAEGSSAPEDNVTWLAVTFVVLPSNYYKATAAETGSGTVPVLNDWFEWDLL